MQDASRPAGKTPRRRLRTVSLGAFLMLVAIAGILIGYPGYHERYIKQVTVSYPVRDLVPKQQLRKVSRVVTVVMAPGQSDLDGVVRGIQSDVMPSSWQGQGGTGTITPFFLNDSLIVVNSRAAQDGVAAFLRARRSTAKGVH